VKLFCQGEGSSDNLTVHGTA